MNRLHLFLAASALSLSTLMGSLANAAPTTFNKRADWQVAAGAPKTIDFSVNDSGSPISNPAADVLLSSLTLKGVTFLNVHSYMNQYLYTPNSTILRVNLPANTLSFGTDLRPLIDTSGTYTVKLSTGEVYTPAAGVIPLTNDFFGVVSTTPIEWIEVSLNTTYLVMDNFSFVAIDPVQQVGIDIVPGSTINPINLSSGGEIPVAILSTATFAATSVNPASVRFGLLGTEAAPIKYGFVDVNRDGRKDMVLLFRTRQTGIKCGATLAKLTGKTTTGTALAGSDKIKTVNCNCP
jgi:hypothetical protein